MNGLFHIISDTCMYVNVSISFLLLSEWLEMIYSNQLKQISSLLLKDKTWDNIAETDKSQTYVDSWQLGTHGLTYNKSFSSLFNLIVLIVLSYLHFHLTCTNGVRLACKYVFKINQHFLWTQGFNNYVFEELF